MGVGAHRSEATTETISAELLLPALARFRCAVLVASFPEGEGQGESETQTGREVAQAESQAALRAHPHACGDSHEETAFARPWDRRSGLRRNRRGGTGLAPGGGRLRQTGAVLSAPARQLLEQRPPDLSRADIPRVHRA